MKARLFVSLGLLAGLLLAAPSAEAGVMRVVVVQADDADAYVKAIAQGQALITKAGSPSKLRVWRAQYAGPDAGAIVVAIEYADLAALAKDNALMAGSAEIRGWLAGLGKIRRIVSDSVYEELKP